MGCNDSKPKKEDDYSDDHHDDDDKHHGKHHTKHHHKHKHDHHDDKKSRHKHLEEYSSKSASHHDFELGGHKKPHGGPHHRTSTNIYSSSSYGSSSSSEDSGVNKVVGGGKNYVDFRTSLREAGDKLVLIKFYEEKCEDCEAMSKLYQEFVSKYPGVLFLEANVTNNNEAVDQLRIKMLPTFIAFKNHLEVGRLVDTRVEDIENLIRKNI